MEHKWAMVKHILKLLRRVGKTITSHLTDPKGICHESGQHVMKAANVGSCRNEGFFCVYSEKAILWLSYMKFGRLSRFIAEAKMPVVCAEMDATHAENYSSSSQIFYLKVKIFFYCKQTVGHLRCKVPE